MFKKLFGKGKSEVVYAHATGEFVALENVPDPVFSQKMMGEGIAIKPTSGIVVAPLDGEIIQLAETKHAFGLRTALGQEILVHIGLETVALKGKGFDVLVNIGDKVKKGQPIVKADLNYIGEHAKSTIIPMVVTNNLNNEYALEQKKLANTQAGETEVFTATLQ